MSIESILIFAITFPIGYLIGKWSYRRHISPLIKEQRAVTNEALASVDRVSQPEWLLRPNVWARCH